MIIINLMSIRYHSYHLIPSNLIPKLFSSPCIFSLHRTSTTTTTTSTTPSFSLSTTYGPSLQNGTLPSITPLIEHPQNPLIEGFEIPPFDEHQFTRVYEIAALRVPSNRCFELESTIRGHLLNWPRVPNIARVPGDEIDEDIRDILVENKAFGVNNNDDDDEVSKAVSRRIYGRAEGDGEPLTGVLYRDKLAKEFNSRGFVNFRNLAKISRPVKSKNKKKNKGWGEGESGGEEGKGEKRRRKRKVLVEVVEETGCFGGDGDGEDLSVLLGDEFKGRKWRGSTRLLLLDETCSGRSFDELPQAVKVALRKDSSEGTKSRYELVKCNMTLFYDYWSTDEVLGALLPKNMIIPSSFETVGHIAHLNLQHEHLPYRKVIAKVVLDKNKPKIQTVVNKTEAISNRYRTMELEVLAGNRSLVTTVIESGLRFHVDLAKVYWNSRLSTERQRLVSCFTRDDVLCDVFAGVGPISIAAAKKVKRVYANDLNPCAVDYLERNSVLNKLERKIKVYNMDGRRFIEAIFNSNNASSVTQVVMNLPNNAVEFLDAFRGIFRNKPRDKSLILPTIHIYGFSNAVDPEFDFHERIRVVLQEAAVSVEMRRVRLVSPGKWMLCASFVLPGKVAFSKEDVVDV